MDRISRTAVRELATAALQLLGLVQALRALRSLPHLLLVGSTSPLAEAVVAARGGSGRRAPQGAAHTSAHRRSRSRFPMFALHRLQHPLLTNPPQHSPHVLHRHRPAPPHRQPGPRAAATLRARTCSGGAATVYCTRSAPRRHGRAWGYNRVMRQQSSRYRTTACNLRSTQWSCGAESAASTVRGYRGRTSPRSLGIL